MIPREEYINKISMGFKYNPIVVLTGARQVGKTTLMEMFMQNNHCLWLNGQNPETSMLFDNFSTLERYLKLNLNNEMEGWLAIDEFQYIDRVSLFLKLLADQYKGLKILCSGSSSLNILQEVDESLAGRIRLIPVYSLNFSEYVTFIDPELAAKYKQCSSGDDINTLFPKVPVLLNEYLTFGGLPKVTLADDAHEKEELLNDIYQTYLLKDVRQFVRNQDFVPFNKLLRILASGIGNLLNINELSNLVRLSHKQCEEYISLLEQMFIIHLVKPFSQNKRKEISKMSKIYFCDIGLRNIIYNSFNDIHIRTDNGRIFENYVYLQLLQYYKQGQILFYRTKDGSEIDFILSDITDQIIPLEVKFKDFNKPLRIRAMTEFGKALPFEKGYIINLNLIGSSENQYYIQPYLTRDFTSISG
jgi:uncharacterized protein